MLSVLLQDESRYQAQTLWSCKLEKKLFSFLRHWFIMRMREENVKWWRGRQTTRDVTTTWTRRQASCRTLQAERIHHTLQFSLLRRRADPPGEFEKSLRLVSSRDATSFQSVKLFWKCTFCIKYPLFGCGRWRIFSRKCVVWIKPLRLQTFAKCLSYFDWNFEIWDS